MSRYIYFECASGVSGDMTVAALLDLGADQGVLQRALTSIVADGFEVRIGRRHRAGLDACDFDVVLDAAHDGHDHDMEYLYGHIAPQVEESEGGAIRDMPLPEVTSASRVLTPFMKPPCCALGISQTSKRTPRACWQSHVRDMSSRWRSLGCASGQPDRAQVPTADVNGGEGGAGHKRAAHAHTHSHEHRNLADVQAILSQVDMTPGAAALANRTFEILARAEARAHGVPLDQVHFHEVGAIDSIVDIVAAAVCADNLAQQTDAAGVVVGALTEGTGTVRCQHGVLPVPVPAVVNIAAECGLELHQCAVRGEMVTPTGAALMAAMRTCAQLPESFTIKRVGMGAGKRTHEGASGILRAMLIEAAPASAQDAPASATEVSQNADLSRQYASETNLDNPPFNKSNSFKASGESTQKSTGIIACKQEPEISNSTTSQSTRPASQFNGEGTTYNQLNGNFSAKQYEPNNDTIAIRISQNAPLTRQPSGGAECGNPYVLNSEKPENDTTRDTPASASEVSQNAPLTRQYASETNLDNRNLSEGKPSSGAYKQLQEPAHDPLLENYASINYPHSNSNNDAGVKNFSQSQGKSALTKRSLDEAAALLPAGVRGKFDQLRAHIARLGSLAVAYSGGVDSTLLLAVAHQVLGDAALGITACTRVVPSRELEAATQFCCARKIPLQVVNFDELSVAAFATNPPDRCYHCKLEIMGGVKAAAAAAGMAHVAEGSNVDDLADYRPGHKAVAELGLESPLLAAGLTKAEIRQISRALGLPTWNKPSFACLASRVPYGSPITAEKLAQVDAAEQLLYDEGFAQFRVRHHGSIARIEVAGEDIERLCAPPVRKRVEAYLKQLGFTYVTVDLGGFRSGSLNAGLQK